MQILTIILKILSTACLIGNVFKRTKIFGQKFTKNFSFSNCDYCVTDEKCGFCVEQNKKIPGYCFPVNSDHSDKSSSVGFCSDNFTYNDNIHTDNYTNYEWMDVYCKTKFTILPIIIMVVYLCFFSFGIIIFWNK